MEREEERECEGKDSSLVPEQTQMENEEKNIIFSPNRVRHMKNMWFEPCGITNNHSHHNFLGPKQITPIIDYSYHIQLKTIKIIRF